LLQYGHRTDWLALAVSAYKPSGAAYQRALAPASNPAKAEAYCEHFAVAFNADCAIFLVIPQSAPSESAE
jgi:hypothetical protein